MQGVFGTWRGRAAGRQRAELRRGDLGCRRVDATDGAGERGSVSDGR